LESGHHFESQAIQRIQNVFGRTLRVFGGFFRTALSSYRISLRPGHALPVPQAAVARVALRRRRLETEQVAGGPASGRSGNEAKHGTVLHLSPSLSKHSPSVTASQ